MGGRKRERERERERERFTVTGKKSSTQKSEREIGGERENNIYSDRSTGGTNYPPPPKKKKKTTKENNTIPFTCVFCGRFIGQSFLWPGVKFGRPTCCVVEGAAIPTVVL